MPASIISPDFSAPWYPDAQYLFINGDNAAELYVDYPAMYRDRKAALAVYHRDAVRSAQRNKQPVPKLGHYTDDIIEALGYPPRALEMIAAAAQGHPWVLGHVEAEDPRLVPYLEQTSVDLERELDEFDFGIDSYEDAIGQKRGTAPRMAPNAPRKAKTYTSLAELEADADALPVGEAVGEEEDDVIESEETADAMAEFDDLGDDAVDSVPDEDEETGDTALVDDDDEEDALEDLDETHDSEARGGRRVDPRKQEIAKRQDARRPTQTAKPRKTATQRSAGGSRAPEKEKASTRSTPRAFDREAHKGKSLADGARPFVGK
jgi:hypothetical protein